MTSPNASFKDVRNRNVVAPACEACRNRPVAGVLTVAIDEPRGPGQKGGSKRIAAELFYLCEPCVSAKFLEFVELLNPRVRAPRQRGAKD